MSFSGESGAWISGDRQDVGQECEDVSSQWGLIGRGQQKVGQLCEDFKIMSGRSVRRSAGSGSGL